MAETPMGYRIHQRHLQKEVLEFCKGNLTRSFQMFDNTL